MATNITGDRFEAKAVCQKISSLFGQQALTSCAAQTLNTYEAQFTMISNEDNDDILV